MLPDMPVAEKELTREVGALNHVIIGDGDSATTTGHSHHRQVLHQLTAKRTGTDQKEVLLLHLHASTR